MLTVVLKSGESVALDCGDNWGVGSPPGWIWAADAEGLVHYFPVETIAKVTVPLRVLPEDDADDVLAD